MESKRPCAQQQPGVVDEMANAIVRQVKAQRVVVNKGPMYSCVTRDSIDHDAEHVNVWSAVVGEQRTYAMQVNLAGTGKEPCWGDIVHFTSPKVAANAIVETVGLARKCSIYPTRFKVKGTGVVVLNIGAHDVTDPVAVSKAVTSVAQLLTSDVYIAV